MKIISYFTSILLFTSLVYSSYGQEIRDSSINLSPGMNNLKMHEIIESEAKIIEGAPGAWQILYGERLVLIITDEANNRMRIFTPIIAEDEIKSGEIKTILEANFHSALDAKYCLYEGFVMSVFTHPLKELQTAQFIDAMRQVVVLADNYGSSYSSTGLIFGGGQESEEEKKSNDKLNKKPGKKS